MVFFTLLLIIGELCVAPWKIVKILPRNLDLYGTFNSQHLDRHQFNYNKFPFL